jgi:hypothetical protein
MAEGIGTAAAVIDVAPLDAMRPAANRKKPALRELRRIRPSCADLVMHGLDDIS